MIIQDLRHRFAIIFNQVLELAHFIFVLEQEFGLHNIRNTLFDFLDLHFKFDLRVVAMLDEELDKCNEDASGFGVQGEICIPQYGKYLPQEFLLILIKILTRFPIIGFQLENIEKIFRDTRLS